VLDHDILRIANFNDRKTTEDLTLDAELSHRKKVEGRALGR